MKTNILVENSFNGVETFAETILEGQQKVKRWYVEGTFLQANVVNKNRRMYPLGLMEEEVANYDRDYVKQSRAVGELSHPTELDINLDKITHLTESVKQNGANFIGRAKILNTPCGKIVEGLLGDGVRLGVSSRAGGALKEAENGVSEVTKMKLVAIDIVFSPSAPDALVKGIMEGAPFVWDTVGEDVEFVESLKHRLDTKRAYKDPEQTFKAFEAFMNRIRGL